MSKLDKIWEDVEPTVSVCDSLYRNLSDPLEDVDAKKLYNVRTFFFRGIFEASFETNQLDKNEYSNGFINCYKRFILSSSSASKMSEDQINSFANHFYNQTEIVINETDEFYEKYKNSCLKIISAGKESYKKGGTIISTEALSKMFNNYPILDYHKW